jgi:ankyrin repeat protein
MATGGDVMTAKGMVFTTWHRTGITLLLAGIAWSTVAHANTDIESLIAASRAQDSETVQALLLDGVNVNGQQADGATALHWAAYRDDLNLANLLIKAGADLNKANELGATPLFLAADNGSADMVKLLLESGANPNVPLQGGESPLMTAARTGNADAVQNLIEHGADVNLTEDRRGQSALMWAVAQGHNKVTTVLIHNGAELMARSRVRPRLMHNDSTNGSQYDQGFIWNRGGYTPLLFAARHGNIEAGRLLVKAGATIDDRAPTGATALAIAVQSGHSEFAQFALTHGADPNDFRPGYAPLHVAVLRGDSVSVKNLLAHGADPNKRYEKGTPVRRASRDWYLMPHFVSATPFWLASYYQEPEIMRLLVDGGADQNLTTLELWHPVFERAGAVGPPHIAGGFQTALQAAARGRHDRGRSNLSSAVRDPDEDERITLEAVKLAREFGVNINHADHVGNTALHTAAQRNHETVVRFLAEHGATLDIKNQSDQTPLVLAKRAEAGRLARPDITRYPSGNSAEALRELGAVDESEDTKAENEQ